MKIMTKLLALAGLVWTAILIDRRRQRRLGGRPGDAWGSDAKDRFGVPLDAVVVEAELVTGIADVDPEPLTQVAGEGIDPSATRTAHRAVTEQRGRMPVRGKNIP